MNERKPILPLILSVLLALGCVLALAVHLERFSGIKWESVWHLSADEITVRPMTPDELPEAPSTNRDYYMIEFDLTNNSPQALEGYYCFEIVPDDGEAWSVNYLPYLDQARFAPEILVPAGCTGRVQLPIEVDPEDLYSDWLTVYFDYGPYENEYLGMVCLP